MPKKLPRYSQYQKDLIRRYLVWCYKTTKEELDRIERYFTQLDVDAFVLKDLRSNADYRQSQRGDPYRQIVDQFEGYMKKKEENVLKKKYSDVSKRSLDPQFIYLKNRFAALEKAIGQFLGKRELEAIRRSYEEEMTRRILQSTEHS